MFLFHKGRSIYSENRLKDDFILHFVQKGMMPKKQTQTQVFL